MSTTETAAREETSSASVASPDPVPAPPSVVPTDVATAAADIASGARELTDGLVTQSRSLTVAALSGARGRIREAEERLAEEEREWDARAEAAALPNVKGADPMNELAVRIDRESDYWRTFAVRSLRPGAARNLAIAGAVLALVSGLALAVLGTLAALFGSEGPGRSALATAAGVAVCAVVACALGVVSERGRVQAAREALHRADQAERRLERVAAILALKSANATKYVEALARLERER